MAVIATTYPLGYDIHDIETYFLPPFLFVAIWIGLGFTLGLVGALRTGDVLVVSGDRVEQMVDLEMWHSWCVSRSPILKLTR